LLRRLKKLVAVCYIVIYFYGSSVLESEPKDLYSTFKLLFVYIFLCVGRWDHLRSIYAEIEKGLSSYHLSLCTVNGELESGD